MDKQKLLNTFEKHLINQLRFQEKTRTNYKYNAGMFLDWVQDNQLQLKQVTNSQVYDYIAYIRSKDNGQKKNKTNSHETANRHRIAVRHFYNSIGVKNNPALKTKMAKEDRKIPTNIIDEEFLDNIYRETIANTLAQKRDRCMLGMVVFLGLQRAELQVLELEHLDLENARIYVSKTTHANERYLTLNPVQIMHLSNYVHDIRNRLLKETNQLTNKLFFSYGASSDLNNVMYELLSKLKKRFGYVKSFQQLKQSRMVIWVREYGLREAQYRGGYRFLTSVQRYDFKSLEDLKQKLAYLHPLEKIG